MSKLHTIPTSLYNSLDDFKKHLINYDLSDVSIKGYLSDIKYFFDWVLSFHDKELNFDDIVTMDLRAFREVLVKERRLKAVSVNRKVQALRRFFGWAFNKGLIKQDPSQEIQFMKRPSRRKPKSLTNKEVHAILCTVGKSPHGLSDRNYALIQFMLQTGLRLKEVGNLQYRDLQLYERSGSVTVTDGKGRKERDIPLNVTARRALSRYLKDRDIKPNEAIFLNKQGYPMAGRSIQKVISELGKRAKIDRIQLTAHVLRHTFATNFLKSNPGRLVELSDLLGHSSPDTTIIYTKPSQESLEEAVEKSEINIYD